MRRLLCAVFLMLFASGAFSSYPYTACPMGKWTLEGDKYSSSLDAWVDIYGFAQCNCTSYVAYKINEATVHYSGTEPMFCNNFALNGDSDTQKWGHAYEWRDAVNDRTPGYVSRYPVTEAGLPVKTPDGDYIVDPSVAIAWWDSSVGGGYGHVAWVESVAEDGKTVTISEYNWDNERYLGNRVLAPSNSKYPHAFLYLYTSSFEECDLTGLCSDECFGEGSFGGNSNPQPNDPVNLTQDTDILGADGNELYAGRDVFLDGMKAKVRVAVTAKGGDAGNWKTKGSSRIIHIKYLVSTNDGPWNV
ncbi:MAG: CHAP domain-containing protein, partial [Verrucomicrobiae bacterium]|nr:CHAP domain-containing protein [Verrucomicrobiae bacterium]